MGNLRARESSDSEAIIDPCSVTLVLLATGGRIRLSCVESGGGGACIRDQRVVCHPMQDGTFRTKSVCWMNVD